MRECPERRFRSRTVAKATSARLPIPAPEQALDSPAERPTASLYCRHESPTMLLDFLPIVLFFVTYFLANANADEAARFATEHLGAIVSGGVVAPDVAPVLLATVVVCVATLAQIAGLLVMRKKVHTLLWVTFAPRHRARRR